MPDEKSAGLMNTGYPACKKAEEGSRLASAFLHPFTA
jgi:hypothetical protein